MTVDDNFPVDGWHFLGFLALLIFVLWFTRVWWRAVEDRRHACELGQCESCRQRVPRTELGLVDYEGACRSVCSTCAWGPR